VLLGDTNVESAVDANDAGQAEAFPYRASASGKASSASFCVDGSNTATERRA
jgi:hypothetical protein